MSIIEYLQSKYPFFPNAQTPIQMIEDELHIPYDEVQALVRKHTGKKFCPKYVPFSIFVEIVANVLSGSQQPI